MRILTTLIAAVTGVALLSAAASPAKFTSALQLRPACGASVLSTDAQTTVKLAKVC